MELVRTVMRLLRKLDGLFASAEPAGSWGQPDVEITCDRCGYRESRPLAHYLAQYGPDKDLNDIERERKVRCGRYDCRAHLEGSEIPSLYR